MFVGIPKKIFHCRHFREKIWPKVKFVTEKYECEQNITLVERVGGEALLIKDRKLLKDCGVAIFKIIKGMMRRAKNQTIQSYRTALRKGWFLLIVSCLCFETREDADDRRKLIKYFSCVS